MENRNLPAIPLPNPGEGGAVNPGNTSSSTDNAVIPLPNPGEGGPVNPGTPVAPIQPLPGFIPVIPQAATLRFLNAACGYPPLSLYIGSAPAAGPLQPGTVSAYVRLNSGRHIVTITDSSGYIYLQMRMRFESGDRYTLSAALRTGGLELLQIQES